MTLKAALSCAVALVLMLACGNAYGADNEIERTTLRGLRGIGAGVQEINQEVVREGLTQDVVRADAELKLRLAGIRVLSDQEVVKEPGIPHLNISVAVMKVRIGNTEKGYAYGILVSLDQLVSLSRSPAIEAFGKTWTARYMGTAPELEDVRDRVKDLIDFFINDYLSVNPKK